MRLARVLGSASKADWASLEWLSAMRRNSWATLRSWVVVRPCLNSSSLEVWAWFMAMAGGGCDSDRQACTSCDRHCSMSDRRRMYSVANWSQLCGELAAWGREKDSLYKISLFFSCIWGQSTICCKKLYSFTPPSKNNLLKIIKI